MKYITYEGRHTTVFKYHFRVLSYLRFSQLEAFSLNMYFFLLKSLQVMAQSARNSRQVMTVITNHGLVQLLVTHAIARFQIPWEIFWESTEEEIATIIVAREETLEEMGEVLEAMEEGFVAEDEYIDQEELKEMEMETEESEQNRELEAEKIVEAITQELASTVEPMEEKGLQQERVDMGEAISIMSEVVPQEL